MQKKSVFHPVSGRSIVSMERANREGMGIFLSESRSVFLGRGNRDGWMDRSSWGGGVQGTATLS